MRALSLREQRQRRSCFLGREVPVHEEEGLGKVAQSPPDQEAQQRDSGELPVLAPWTEAEEGVLALPSGGVLSGQNARRQTLHPIGASPS